ncbi:glycosyltransferase family protein [Paramagnetospirillum kuznetsovii]|uniref:glycosyltransferase family protein n=1 Tax=Paramagnetospirillum kuznetsovii TaxID=2053833 RepID=UPI001374CFC5|nr:glycosyltransferase [Paramagnetospirillum kuznetsovii]
MVNSPDAERGLHGAVMAGWIEEQAPEPIQSLLFDLLDTWQSDPERPTSLLWHSIAQALVAEGCFDAEVACWEALSGLAAGEPAVLCRLAEAHGRRGDTAAARAALAGVPPHHPSRVQSLLLRMELGESSCADELIPALLARPAWEPAHHQLVRRLVAAGMAARASGFLAAWTAARPADGVGMLLELGWLAMHVGDAAAARDLFQRLWALNDPDITGVAGCFDGSIPPYTPEVEASILARVEAAFALPESGLARVTLADGPLPSLKVMFVGFERLALPNDLAEHFRRAAQAAGVDFSLYLDNAIVFSHEFRGGDDAVRDRVAAFEAALDERRPDMVILDSAYMPSQRGLRPERMRDLADRLGFHLVCMMRDALDSTLPYLLAWAPVADTILTYDPHCALLRPDHAAFHSKVLVTLPPAQHLSAEGANRDMGLLFVGANTYGVRNMLLSVLMTEDIPFTAIIGERRAVETPDMDSYATALGRARAVLNVAAHSRSEFLVTGRVFESIACGAVLLEQDNAGTASFFTPWRHYLPWTHVADIVQLCRFVERNPDLAARMAAEARGWLDRNYDCRRFWASLLGRHHVPAKGRSPA